MIQRIQIQDGFDPSDKTAFAQFLLDLNRQIDNIVASQANFDMGSAAPASSDTSYPVPFYRFNSSPVSGGVAGWVQISQGVWKSFGTIA